MNRIKVKPPSANRARALERDRHSLPFGPPPLLDGEDAAVYDDLYARVAAAVRPADILEEIWVRDTVDLTWEVFRLRRLKVALFPPIVDEEPDEDVPDEDASDWLFKNVDIVDRIDLMIARAEARRNAMLHEVDRHRAVVAHNLRRSVAQIEGDDYRVIEDKSPERKRLS